MDLSVFDVAAKSKQPVVCVNNQVHLQRLILKRVIKELKRCEVKIRLLQRALRIDYVSPQGTKGHLIMQDTGGWKFSWRTVTPKDHEGCKLRPRTKTTRKTVNRDDIFHVTLPGTELTQ